MIWWTRRVIGGRKGKVGKRNSKHSRSVSMCVCVCAACEVTFAQLNRHTTGTGVPKMVGPSWRWTRPNQMHRPNNRCLDQFQTPISSMNPANSNSSCATWNRLTRKSHHSALTCTLATCLTFLTCLTCLLARRFESNGFALDRIANWFFKVNLGGFGPPTFSKSKKTVGDRGRRQRRKQSSRFFDWWLRQVIQWFGKRAANLRFWVQW